MGDKHAGGLKYSLTQAKARFSEAWEGLKIRAGELKGSAAVDSGEGRQKMSQTSWVS